MYYLVEITTKADKIETGIYKYETKQDAVANFHTKLGGAMKNVNYLAETLVVLNEDGGVVESDNFKQTPTPSFTVSFNSYGGSAVDSQEVLQGLVATVPTPPTREGYTFIRWELNGYEYDFNTPVESDITLVARWEASEPPVTSYTVDFNSYGGSAVDSQTVVAGETATEPTAPTKDGYTFTSWELNGYAYDFNTPVEANIVLVARWELTPVD